MTITALSTYTGASNVFYTPDQPGFVNVLDIGGIAYTTNPGGDDNLTDRVGDYDFYYNDGTFPAFACGATGVNCETTQIPYVLQQISNVQITNAPEPATWVMMLVGFAGLGFAGYRAHKPVASAS